MKFLKYLFFLILIAIIGFSLYIATLDGDYQVEENIVVAAPLEMFFDDVNNYRTWEKWSPWIRNNSEMIVTYTEKTSGEGAGFSWKSDELEGSIKTTEVIPGKTIEQEILFKTPLGEAKSEVYWLFETKENGTEITWGMKGEQQFWEKAYELTQDSTRTEIIRPMLETGLNNLAAFVKKAMEVYEISVDGTTMYSGGYYMYMTTASRNTGNALEAKMRKILPYVSLYMKQNNIPITGAPLTVYNNFDEQNASVIISVGIPTSSRIITPEESEVLCGFLPNQKVVKATLKGNYDHLPEAWAAAKNYIQENEYEMDKTANPFEVYRTNPEDVHNPAKWITEVYLPIK